MLNIVLYEPEIPPNTGNIIRLCANIGATLHLIEPLGFKVDDKKLIRAGLDYHAWTEINKYANYNDFLTQCSPKRLFACTTKGKQNYAHVQYERGDAFLFGPETRGLPLSLLASFEPNKTITIPMQSYSRSLNLSNAVAIIAFEAWRQLGFACS